jgi:uncharacterized membrane protein
MVVKKEVQKQSVLYSLTHHEFHPKDLLQVMIGASILAIPVGFTEETWELGGQLPLLNIIGLLILSVLFISAFVYYNYHRHHRLRKHWNEFVKRVFSTYVFSFLVVAILLTLIQRAPWATDTILAIKRVIIVTFPASMSAAIADVIK